MQTVAIFAICAGMAWAFTKAYAVLERWLDSVGRKF